MNGDRGIEWKSTTNIYIYMWDCHRIFSKKCFFCVGVYRILPESIWFEESGWFDSPVPSQCWEVWEVPRVPCWTPSWMKSWRTNVSWTSAPFAHRRRWGCLSIRGMVRYGVEWFCRNSWERLWNDSGGNQMMKHNSFSLAHWHGLWIHEIPWDSLRFHEIPWDSSKSSATVTCLAAAPIVRGSLAAPGEECGWPGQSHDNWRDHHRSHRSDWELPEAPWHGRTWHCHCRHHIHKNPKMQREDRGKRTRCIYI